MRIPSRLPDSGFSLIEVLVTLVLLAIGLIGLAGLQAKTSLAEMESYQRAQALIIAQDLAFVHVASLDHVDVSQVEVQGVEPVAVAEQDAIVGGFAHAKCSPR